ncbi:MAG: DNA translocase FtsK 4TM domain-containing protein [bacterium]
MAKRTSGKRSTRSATAKSRPQQGPATPVWRDLLGIALLTASVMAALSVISFHPSDPPNGSSEVIHNLLSRTGAHIAYALVQYTFGRWISLILPLLLAAGAFDLLLGKGPRLLKRLLIPTLASSMLAVTIWGTVRGLQGMPDSLEAVGLVGWGLTYLLLKYLGKTGAVILLSAITLMHVTILLRIQWRRIGSAIVNGFRWLIVQFRRIPSPRRFSLPKLSLPKSTRIPLRSGRSAVIVKTQADQAVPKPHEEEASPELPADVEPPPVKERPRVIYASRPPNMPPEQAPTPKPSVKPEKKTPAKDAVNVEEPDPASYHLPTSDLLIPVSEEAADLDPDMLEQQAQMLEKRLLEFGVEAKVIAIHPGPVITRYDLKPAPGVKVSRFAALSDDLALSLTAARVRIIAPIPGAGAVGIEVPNPKPRIVRLREIIESEEFQKADSALTIALGKTAQGDEFVVDLAEMPHLLIAGTTGSGKSVCINTIIASLLMRNRPQDVMIAMVDPKKLELSIYQELRRHHLLFLEENDEVIATTPKSAVNLLISIVREMERRYDLLSESGARNITEFNRMLENGRIKPDEEGKLPPCLPYLVLLVDELADLMITAARDVEEPITRLAQLARAVGVHLVLATQRPSADVITGLIKANFPARIAFKVAEKTNSRIILDHSGAEALIGKGDGLYLDNSDPFPKRFHCALVTTDEVRNLIAHVRKQPIFVKNVVLTLPIAAGGNGDNGLEMADERDALFEEAVRIVARHQQGSVSLLQRKLKIGYSRAGRLLDQLEQAGIVGPFEGSKAREVFIDQQDVESFLNRGSDDDED